MDNAQLAVLLIGVALVVFIVFMAGYKTGHAAGLVDGMDREIDRRAKRDRIAELSKPWEPMLTPQEKAWLQERRQRMGRQ